MESLVGEHVKEATARLGIRKLLLDTPVAMPERLTEMVKLKQLFDEEYVRQLASMDTQ